LKGPSGAITGEGIVTLEDDSSICVTAPEDLLVGQGIEFDEPDTVLA
jgi:hypothetical protein